MADKAENAAEGEEGGKKKLPLWVIILIVSQVVIVAVVIVVFKMMMSSSHTEDGAGEEGAATEEHGGKKEEGGHGKAPSNAEQKADPSKVSDPSTLVGPQFDLEPFVVNLVDDGRGAKYLKVEIKFELEPENSDAVKAELGSRLSAIRDELLILFSTKRTTDIETGDGKRILKDEIFTRVNRLLVTGRIKRVYFTDFVIQ